MALDADSRHITLDEREKQYVKKMCTICEDFKKPTGMIKICNLLPLGNFGNASQIASSSVGKWCDCYEYWILCMKKRILGKLEFSFMEKNLNT